jgi:hypothetical protein
LNEPASSWSGHARVDDKNKNSSHTVTVDFVAQKNKNVRMDITTGIGIYIATLVARGTNVEYLLARKKEFYSGPATESALKPILGMSLNPNILQTLLYDTEPAASDWHCDHDAAQVLSRCVSTDKQIEMTWQNRSESGKTIAITSPKVAVLMHLGAARANTAVTDQTFHLAVPSGYKQFDLHAN